MAVCSLYVNVCYLETCILIVSLLVASYDIDTFILSSWDYWWNEWLYTLQNHKC